MITSITGMPGSGKSFFLAYRAMKAIKEGRPVFANFPLKGAYKIKVTDLIDYVFPQGSLVLIDEAGRWFNAKDWNSLPPEVFDTFTLHRHLKIDLMLAMNATGYVDINIRRVAELTYWAENRRLSPFFHYKGYYDLEKTGTMNREHDVAYNIPKFSRAKFYYDTYAMSSAFKNRPIIPKIKYGPRPYTRIEVIKRFIRKKSKIQKMKRIVNEYRVRYFGSKEQF